MAAGGGAWKRGGPFGLKTADNKSLDNQQYHRLFDALAEPVVTAASRSVNMANDRMEYMTPTSFCIKLTLQLYVYVFVTCTYLIKAQTDSEKLAD